MIIFPKYGALRGEVHLPSSKSESNRYLLLHALAGSGPEPEHLSEANDTRLLKRLLQQIRNKEHSTLNAEDAGTVLRFLAPYIAAMPGSDFILTGTARLCERPMSPLIDALRTLGADIVCLEREGFAPLRIRGRELQGGTVHVAADQSSQFISALCLLAPTLPLGLHIIWEGEAVSAPYIGWTLQVLKAYGVETQWETRGLFIPFQPIEPRPVRIAADWSSASFFFCMAMLAPHTELLLRDLRIPSPQADARMETWVQHFGIRVIQESEGIRIINTCEPFSPEPRCFDVSDCPDLAIPFITACALRFPMMSFTGLHTLDLKESPRLQVLCEELKNAGCVLRLEGEVLFFGPLEERGAMPASLKTRGDHRMAMSFALAALMGITVSLDDADCVRKSFPGYWEQLRALGFICQY